MVSKKRMLLYFLLALASIAIISLWTDWNMSHRVDFNTRVSQADDFYNNADYHAASTIYKDLVAQHPKKRQLTVGEGSLIFFFFLTSIVFFVLYLDSRRKLRSILSNSIESDKVPELLHVDYHFDKVVPKSEADQKMLMQLRTLFDEKEVFLDKDMSVDVLASMLGTTKSNISHLINDSFHCNFPTFLNNYRVNKAISLFNKYIDVYTIEALAEECGFNNRQVFHSAFKKRVGMPPSKFRDLIKHKQVNT